MVLTCPFRAPLPEPKPFHVALMETFGDYGDSTIALEEEGGNKKLTFGQVRRVSCSIAYSLRDGYGFRKGDVVLWYLENRIEFPILFLGVSALGGATSGANPLYTYEELGKQAIDSGAKFIVTSEARLPVVLKAVEGMKDSSTIRAIFIIDPTPKTATLKSSIALAPFDGLCHSSVPERNGQPVFPPIDINPKTDPVLLPYSSGTTGLPKGVVLTHYNLLCLLYVRHTKGVFWAIGKGDVAVLFLPFFHMAGFMGLIVSMHHGGLGVIMRHFDSAHYLAAVQKYRATLIYAVPSVLVFLARDPSVAKYDLSSVKAVIFGAAPAGRELIEAVIKRLPKLESIIQGYGLTESGGLASITPRMPVAHYPLGSCGVPTPYTEVKVVSIDGKNEEVGPMDRGEIWLRGPNNMLCYHKNEKATKETLDSDGWLHTGDIGYYDYFGHLYIVDRLKELIKYKGYQVAPAELEDILLKHAAVQEVAVTGIPDEENPDVGELPTAFVVLKPGHTATENTANSIKATVAEHLAPFKQLRGGVVFLKQIPKGGTGKVLRRALKEIEGKAYGIENAYKRAKL